jgi:4-amino-4-deoxy-L-arabinose transferase-like glycosyltransferase
MRRRDLRIFVLLWLVALVPLVVKIGSHPWFAYNWEQYSAAGVFQFQEHPSIRQFGINQGLMTDSGESPVVVIPAWLTFSLLGADIASLRLPLALVASLAVPLLWFTARTLGDERTGVLAALLLAVSPVFWLYARTATSVGISLVPMLLTMLALLHVLKSPGDRRLVLVLQILLVINSWFYAPIRFLWLLALGLLLIEMILRPVERRALAKVFLVTAVTLPVVITVVQGTNPYSALDAYYAGRGEQVFALSLNPERFEEFVPDEHDSGGAESQLDRVGRLLGKNIRDLVYLLIDWERKPVLWEYWNPSGRLYPWFLVPAVLIGFVNVLRSSRRRLEDRVLAFVLIGFTLPMVLTSQVHVGRLIFALPLLFVVTAIGFWAVADFTADLLRRFRHPSRIARGRSPARVIVMATVAGSLVATTLLTSWRDYRSPPPLNPEAAVTVDLEKQYQSLPGRAAGVAIVSLESPPSERFNLAASRMALDRYYRFVDLTTSDEPRPSAGGKPVLLYGGVLARLWSREPLAAACDLHYAVRPSAELAFLTLLPTLEGRCGRELTWSSLPS